jgi:putative cell wall-binding protein
MTGILFSSCESSSRQQKVSQAQVQYIALSSNKERKEMIATTQNTTNSQDWETLKFASEKQFRHNEIRISEIKAKMKRIAALEQTNRKLKTSIETYQQGQVDWELFKRAFNYDMQALGKELEDLSRYTKK